MNFPSFGSTPASVWMRSATIPATSAARSFDVTVYTSSRNANKYSPGRSDSFARRKDAWIAKLKSSVTQLGNQHP